MKCFVTCSILIFTGIVNAQLLWQADLQKIGRKSKIECKATENKLHAAVPAGTKGNYGWFGWIIPAIKEKAYLQINVIDMEKPSANPRPYCFIEKPYFFGMKMYTGWNTFSIAKEKGKSFLFAIIQYCNPKEGPWVDYGAFRVTTRPENGLVVTVNGKTENDSISLGDKLNITYYASRELSHVPEVRFLLANKPIDYHFNRSKRVTLSHRGNGAYQAEITVTDDAVRIIGKSNTLMAMTTVSGINSYFTIPNPVEIKTSNPIPEGIINAASIPVADARRAWYEAIKGENLALGKRVSFMPDLNIHWTKDAEDPLQLTDGKLSKVSNDKLWWGKDSVGWIDGYEFFFKIDC